MPCPLSSPIVPVRLSRLVAHLELDRGRRPPNNPHLYVAVHFMSWPLTTATALPLLPAHTCIPRAPHSPSHRVAQEAGIMAGTISYARDEPSFSRKATNGLANDECLQTSQKSRVRVPNEECPATRSDPETEQFVEFYYNTFDNNRQQLASLYVRTTANELAHNEERKLTDTTQRDDSMLTFEQTPTQGVASIVTKLTVRRYTPWDEEVDKRR